MPKLINPIGWCDETTNAVTGCDKVSPGCKNCYAAEGTRARVLRSRGVETWGPRGVRHPVAEYEAKLRRLNKLCICDACRATTPYDGIGLMCGHCGATARRRIRLFADSNSDWLDEKWPVATLAAFLKAIHAAPNVDVLLLTKRIQKWRQRIQDAWEESPAGEEVEDWLASWGNGQPPANVWLGVSVEDQRRAEERIPLLAQTPAAVRFLSLEPLLGPVVIPLFDNAAVGNEFAATIDWGIVGGESGLNRRDCGVEAIEFVADQFVKSGVPVYVKQDCALFPGQQGRIPAAVWGLKQFPGARGAARPTTEREVRA